MTDDSAGMGYRARFRFRVSKSLNIGESQLIFHIGTQEVKLSPAMPNVPIKDSKWLIANARGFNSEEHVRRFGHDLRAACAVSSVANRLGVDGGVDTRDVRAWGGREAALGERRRPGQGQRARN